MRDKSEWYFIIPLFTTQNIFVASEQKFLKTGNESNLEFGKYSISMLRKTMDVSYIQALVILHNIEHMPNEAPNIYNPNIVE